VTSHGSLVLLDQMSHGAQPERQVARLLSDGSLRLPFWHGYLGAPLEHRTAATHRPTSVEFFVSTVRGKGEPGQYWCGLPKRPRC
jgi:hypothetical protein